MTLSLNIAWHANAQVTLQPEEVRTSAFIIITEDHIPAVEGMGGAKCVVTA